MDQQIKKKLRELRGYKRRYFDIVDAIYSPIKTTSAIELLAFGSLNRSLQLTYAFCDQIKHRRSLVAIPLLRLQLDNASRIAAIYIVEKPDSFAKSILEGTEIRTMLDRNGAKLTDAHLVANLAKTNPWISPLYNWGSGHVHLSASHIIGTFDVLGPTVTVLDDHMNELAELNGSVSTHDVFREETYYLELIVLFQMVTDLFLEQMSGLAKINATLPVQPVPGVNRQPQPQEKDAVEE